MSYKGYGDIMAECPYYSAESRYGITCEGIIKGTKIINKFSTEQEKNEHIKEKCCHYPNVCSLAQIKDIQFKY